MSLSQQFFRWKPTDGICCVPVSIVQISIHYEYFTCEELSLHIFAYELHLEVLLRGKLTNIWNICFA